MRIKLLFIFGTFVSFIFFALSTANALSASISHPYFSTQKIPVDSLVSLDPKQSGYVVPANTGNQSQLFGISTTQNGSIISVNGPGSVQVATTGSAPVLVSTLNGPIKIGDQVAVSPFNGIGMEASNGLRIIGLAQSSFSANSKGAKKQVVTDRFGKTHTIYIGSVLVSIGIGTSVNPQLSNTDFLQKTVYNLTGRVVSPARIIFSLLIAVIAVVSLIILIYASIYGGILAVGRNPLAKNSIIRALISVLVMAILIAGLASMVIFFLLK